MVILDLFDDAPLAFASDVITSTRQFEFNPVSVLIHVEPRLPNGKSAGEGRVRLEKASNSSPITSSNPPLAILAHQILLDDNLALGLNRLTYAPEEFGIRNRNVA